MQQKYKKILSDVPVLKLSLSVMNTSLLIAYRDNTKGIIELSETIIQDAKHSSGELRNMAYCIALDVNELLRAKLVLGHIEDALDNRGIAYN